MEKQEQMRYMEKAVMILFMVIMIKPMILWLEDRVQILMFLTLISVAMLSTMPSFQAKLNSAIVMAILISTI
jgi:hypothetical protein